MPIHSFTPEEKIRNAEIMFGTNSPQHNEAKRRFAQSPLVTLPSSKRQAIAEEILDHLENLIQREIPEVVKVEELISEIVDTEAEAILAILADRIDYR